MSKKYLLSGLLFIFSLFTNICYSQETPLTLEEIIENMQSDELVGEEIHSLLVLGDAVKVVGIGNKELLSSIIYEILNNGDINSLKDQYGETFVSAVQSFGADSSLHIHFKSHFSEQLSILNDDEQDFVWGNYFEYYYDNIDSRSASYEDVIIARKKCDREFVKDLGKCAFWAFISGPVLYPVTMAGCVAWATIDLVHCHEDAIK